MKNSGVWAFIGGILTAMIIGMVADAVTAGPEGDTRVDTVYQWKTRYVPQPAETIRVSVPGDVDTAYVIQEYYTKKVYRDTVLQNDTVLLVVRDTVQENALGPREIMLQVNAEMFRKHHAIGVMGLIGRHQTDLMATYRHKRWQMAAGWDFSQGGPVAGVNYTLKEW